MRRLVAAGAVAAVCIAIVVVLLSSGGGAPNARTPVGDVLGYFPADAPLVAVVLTDVHDAQLRPLAKATGSLPVLPALADDLIHNRLDLHDVSFQADIAPQLGGPLAVGLEHGDLLAVMPLRNPIALKRLLLSKTTLVPQTIVRGRRIWSDSTSRNVAIAVDGHVLVVGASQSAVARALVERRARGRLQEGGFDGALRGLPRHALVRVSIDPRALLASASSLRRLLRLPWFDALRRSAATVTATQHALTLAVRLRSAATRLVEPELPLAPGTGTPLPVLDQSGELGIAVRDPARVVAFADDVLRTLRPRRSAALEQVLRSRGVDLRRDLAAHLGRIAQVALDPATRAWAARLPLRDGAGMATTIGKLAQSLPALASALGIAGVGVATPDTGERFYALARPSGRSVVFGVVRRALVAATLPRRAAALARERARPVPGARGALALAADARALALRVLAPRLQGLAALGAPLVVGALGRLSGSAIATRAGVSGSVTLTLR